MVGSYLLHNLGKRYKKLNPIIKSSKYTTPFQVESYCKSIFGNFSDPDFAQGLERFLDQNSLDFDTAPLTAIAKEIAFCTLDVKAQKKIDEGKQMLNNGLSYLSALGSEICSAYNFLRAHGPVIW